MRALLRLQCAILSSASSQRLALGSSPQSLGEDAHAESTRKRLRLKRSREKMDSDPAVGFAPHPGSAGGRGAIRQSSVDAADVDRSGVLERAEGSATLSLDPFEADAGDVPGAPLDLGRSAILSARRL
jgi:hypothetical protein